MNAEKLQGSLGRLKLAVGGGLALAGGTALIAGLKHITDHTRELSKELATLKTQGLTQIQIKGADAVARATTTMVPGSTESGNLKLIAEANSLMGLENAKKALPDLARAIQVFGAIDGKYKQAQESLYSVLKSGEMLGKLQDEHTHLIVPEKLKSFLDVMARVSAATGNRVNAQTLFGMVQQGAPALANMSDDGLMAMLMAAQQMGGPRAGTALTSLYTQFQGGTMTESKAKELHRLGLIGGYDVGRGGHLNFKEGALSTDFAKSLENNPLQAMKLLTDAMKSHGIEGIEAQTKELFLILGRQTTQRLVSDFLRNATNMEAEQGRIKQGQGLDKQADTRNTEDYGVAEHNMHEAWKNLMEAIGGPNSIAAIRVMNQITGALNYLTEVARAANPDTLVAIAKAIGVLGGALAVGGAGALILALGPAGWLVGGIAALGLGLVAFKSSFDTWVKDITGLGPRLDAADKAFNDFALKFGDPIKLAAGTVADAFKALIVVDWAIINGTLTVMKTVFLTAVDVVQAIYDKAKGLGGIVNGGKPSGTINPSDELPGLKKEMSFNGEGIPKPLMQKVAFQREANDNSGEAPRPFRADGFDPSMVHKAALQVADGITATGKASATAIPGVTGFDRVLTAFPSIANAATTALIRFSMVLDTLKDTLAPLLGQGATGGFGGGAGGIVNASFTTGGGVNDNGGGFGGASGVARAVRGATGGGSGSPMPAVPGSVQMTDAERNTLGLILKYESHGQNTLNYVGKRQGISPLSAKGYTAQGYFQMLNSNWRRIAPGLGINTPNAMSSSLEEQTRVALHLLRHGGVQNWTGFNPALRGALSRGERIQSGAVAGAGSIPDGIPKLLKPNSMPDAPGVTMQPKAPPTAGPPPRQTDKTQIINVHLGDDVIHRQMVHKMVASAQHPRSVGTADDYGSWTHPGRTMTDAA